MNDSINNEFSSYDYKTVFTDGDNASFLIDAYKTFGWEPDKNDAVIPHKSIGASEKNITLHLKRNRKIINKAELTRLQRNFEACLKDIAMLKKQRTAKATAFALICGLIGTAFMAGSTFAVTAEPPHIALCVILAVPGIAGWILPYFIYKYFKAKETVRTEPIIESKLDEIYTLCERGSDLLN